MNVLKILWMNYNTMSSEELQALCDLHGEKNFKVIGCAGSFPFDITLDDWGKRNPHSFVYIDEREYSCLSSNIILTFAEYSLRLRVFYYRTRKAYKNVKGKVVARIRESVDYCIEYNVNGNENKIRINRGCDQPWDWFDFMDYSDFSTKKTKPIL